MKIALVRKSYTDFGGAERYVASLADHLVKSGHDVHIFAGKWESPAVNTTEKIDGRLIFHRVPMISFNSFLKAVSFALNSERMLKKFDFDIIHSFEKTFYQDIYRAGDGCHKEWLLQRRKSDKWWKFLTFSLNPLHIGLLRIEQQIFKKGNFSMIIANSQRGKNEIIRHYCIPSDKIAVLYNPVDCSRFDTSKKSHIRKDLRERLNIPYNVPVLLFVGSGFRRKGLSYLILALSKLKQELHLIIIGKDKIRQYLTIAKNMGIDNKLHFIGPTSAVEDYYLAADLFVLPTIYEPFSNACLEALAAGLPVVTSRINGASEIIEEGRNGYIIEDPANILEVAEKIRLGLKLDAQSVGEFNSLLLDKFSWDKHLEMLLNVYRNITLAKSNPKKK